MRARLTIVLVLTVFACGVRGWSNYLRYLSTELSSEPPFGTVVRQGQLLVNRVQPGAECYQQWGDPARPKPGDRVVAVYDHRGQGGAVRGLFDYGLYLKPINVEEPWTMVVDRPGRAGVTRLSLAMPPSVPLQWSSAQWLANLGVDFYLPFLAILTGLLIGVLRPHDNQAWLASLLFLALGLCVVPTLSQFPPGLRSVALFLQVSAAHLLPYLVFRFFLRFPSRSPVDRALPWLNGLFLGETLVSWAMGLAEEFSLHLSLATAASLEALLARAGLSFKRAEWVFTVFAALMVLAALASIVLNAWQARTRDERRRLRIIAAGATIGLLPAFLLFASTANESKAPLPLLLTAIPLIGLFPLSFAYAVLRHRVFGIRVILRRGLTYALVSNGFLAAEAIFIFLALLGSAGTLLQWLDQPPSLATSTAGTAVATFMLTIGMRQVNRRVLPVIDRRFFRDAYDGRGILNDLSRAVRQMASHPQQLLQHVATQITSALHADRLAVFVRADACSRLVPLERGDGASWELRTSGAGVQRFVLCLDERIPRRAGDAVAARVRFLAARSDLAGHLAASSVGEPDVLEVLTVQDARIGDGEARGDQGPAPGDVEDSGPAGRDARGSQDEAELFERFGTRLLVPLVTAGRLLGFLLLGEKLSEEPYTREDKELLLTVAGQVAIALDYAELIGQAAEQAALRREVQIAQEVQQQLFPHERPPLRSLRYAGVCRAARGVGGDFYDFLPLSADRLGLALADIAGKGLPAALLMASLQALIRSHAPTHTDALEDLASELNRHLVETTDGARFATLFFGVYDDERRHLRYVNAGHLPPLVLRAGTNGASVGRLEAGGMVLGLFGGQSYAHGSIALCRGDRILVFSDGVTEAADPSGEMFGEERLVSAALAWGDGDIEALPAHILREVDRFVGGSPQQDDITVIAAQVV